MNFRILSKLLGVLTILIGTFMLFSLIWADPNIGSHTDAAVKATQLESKGIWALVYSALICWVLGGAMVQYGRSAGNAKIYRKEAMAIVGLSWVLASVLGAMPYTFSGTIRGPSIRVFHEPDTVVVASSRWRVWETWRETDQWKDNGDQDPASLNNAENLIVLKTLANATARGLSTRELIEATGLSDAPSIFSRLKQKSLWNEWLIGPGEESAAPADRATHYRLKWVKMGLIDSLFESQSGFSTTGATVICDLEDPHLVPHCILFWRASTHFLGGLGIIVLFVVLLGQGSAGKALMRTEMPGPTYESSRARMQHTAWRFAGMYVLLNIILALILFFLGMSPFDSICHAFATMATGGFSTYNDSLGHFFHQGLNGRAIEYVVILFMTLAGANFLLLFPILRLKTKQLFFDLEFRTYLAIIAFATVLVVVFGMRAGNADFQPFETAFRNSL
ncbi:hypothetical protein N9V88_00800, partial [bacterium]|nr:hypothetical protein [bacterium]